MSTGDATDAERIGDYHLGEVEIPDRREVWIRREGRWVAAEVICRRHCSDATRVYVRPAGAERYDGMEIYRDDPAAVRPRRRDAQPATDYQVPAFTWAARHGPCWVRVRAEWVPGRVLAWGRHAPDTSWVALTQMAPPEAHRRYVVAWLYHPEAILPRDEERPSL